MQDSRKLQNSTSYVINVGRNCNIHGSDDATKLKKDRPLMRNLMKQHLITHPREKIAKMACFNVTASKHPHWPPRVALIWLINTAQLIELVKTSHLGNPPREGANTDEDEEIWLCVMVISTRSKSRQMDRCMDGWTDGLTKGNPISPFRNFVVTGDNTVPHKNESNFFRVYPWNVV